MLEGGEPAAQAGNADGEEAARKRCNLKSEIKDARCTYARAEVGVCKSTSTRLARVAWSWSGDALVRDAWTLTVLEALEA